MPIVISVTRRPKRITRRRMREIEAMMRGLAIGQAIAKREVSA